MEEQRQGKSAGGLWSEQARRDEAERSASRLGFGERMSLRAALRCDVMRCLLACLL